MLKKYLLYIISRFSPSFYAKILGVKIGSDCRLINVSYGSEPYLISIGNNVSITCSRLETHDGGIWVFRQQQPKIDRIKPIKIGDNVFIGYGCIIMPGVTIGDNVVVGAGSIVTKSIPSHHVFAGIPAKKIKTLDDYKLTIECDEDIELTKGFCFKLKRKFYMDKFVN